MQCGRTATSLLLYLPLPASVNHLQALFWTASVCGSCTAQADLNIHQQNHQTSLLLSSPRLHLPSSSLNSYLPLPQDTVPCYSAGWISLAGKSLPFHTVFYPRLANQQTRSPDASGRGQPEKAAKELLSQFLVRCKDLGRCAKGRKASRTRTNTTACSSWTQFLRVWL